MQNEIFARADKEDKMENHANKALMLRNTPQTDPKEALREIATSATCPNIFVGPVADRIGELLLLRRHSTRVLAAAQEEELGSTRGLCTIDSGCSTVVC